MDCYIPYGCANPDYPEPLEPTMLCMKCSENLKATFLKRFNDGKHLGYGHWQKSNAEIEAAKEAGFIWIGNNSKLQLNGRRLFNEYIPKLIYDKLERRLTCV